MSEKTGVNVTIAGDWSQPATTLIDKISSAIGASFKPRQIRRLAKAEADARIEAANADLKIENLRQNEATEIQELKDRTLKRLVAKEIKRQINIENTLAIAAEKLGQTAIDSSDVNRLSDDFVQSVFEQVENVSEEKLQEYWANLIVAGAESNASRASKLTMRVLSDMDRSDAELFEKVSATLVIMGTHHLLFIGPSTAKVLEDQGITQQDLQHLETLGLLTHQALSGFSFRARFEGIGLSSILVCGKAYYLRLASENFAMKVGPCSLTNAGKQLIKVAKPNWNNEIQNALVQDFTAQGYPIFEIGS